MLGPINQITVGPLSQAADCSVMDFFSQFTDMESILSLGCNPEISDTRDKVQEYLLEDQTWNRPLRMEASLLPSSAVILRLLSPLFFFLWDHTGMVSGAASPQ